MIATLCIYGGMDPERAGCQAGVGLGDRERAAIRRATARRAAAGPAHVRVRLDTRAAHVRGSHAQLRGRCSLRGVGADQRIRGPVAGQQSWRGCGGGADHAQSINGLPVSLFGMAISAAELPAMSSALGNQTEVGAELRRRLDAGWGKSHYSWALGHGAAGAGRRGDGGRSIRRGKITHNDSVYVWGIRPAPAVGLLGARR